MKTISIVVPLYKGNKYIEGIIIMLESNYKYLQKNGFTVTIECIFVNDFPEERVIERYSNFIEIRYLYHTKNNGIHKSRVDGITVANGTYIHMLDQDDIITEEYYFHQLKTMGEADIVVCNGCYHGNKLIFESNMKEFNKTILINHGNKIISPGQTLIKKNSIPTDWMENIVQNSGCDDWLLWILMIYEDASFSYNSQLSYCHIEDGNNQSSHWDKMSLSLKEIKTILTKQTIANEEIKMQSLKCIDKFIYDYEAFYQFEKTWRNIDEKQIKKFLSENDIKRIAVYGYGNIGKQIVHVLKKYDSNIWAMDRDFRYVDEEVRIYRPEDMIPEVDLMIVTPLRGREQIKSYLGEKKEIKDSWRLEDFLYKIKTI